MSVQNSLVGAFNIALGCEAGAVSQKHDAIAIGTSAGHNNQGANSITIGKNINIRAELDALVFNGVKKCITRYKKKIPRFSVDEDSGYGLLRYKKNGYIVEHTDSDKVIFRTLSCSFLLNDKLIELSNFLKVD